MSQSTPEALFLSIILFFFGYIIGRIVEKAKWIEKIMDMDKLKSFFKREKEIDGSIAE